MFQTGGPQMQVWTFPSLEGDDIAPVGIRAADAWKIGRAGKDDGGILLIDARERRTRLEVGRGLEGAIPDVIAGRILRDVLRPALRAGQTYDGILGVIAIVEKAARGELPAGVAGPADGRDARDEGFNPFKLFFGVVFFFLVFILGPLGSLLGGRRRGGRSGGIFFPGCGGGGGWGGGGGGGGGWSGGGGSFGGGGGGGDW